jgi:hypothetical protein
VIVRRAVNALGKLRESSIWRRGALTGEEGRANRLRRRTLAEFYIATLVFGSAGVVGGVPALRQTFGEEYAAVVGLVIAILSVAALIGCGWPARLWRAEFWSVSILAGLIVLYAGAVLWAGWQERDWGRAAVSAAMFGLSTLPRWRVTDLPRQRRMHAWK